MAKKFLDKKRYLEFCGGSCIELWDTHEGETAKDKDGNEKQKPKECLGHFSTVLGALKFYVNVMTSKGRDSSIQEYIKTLSGVYEKFNDVSWLDLAKKQKGEANV